MRKASLRRAFPWLVLLDEPNTRRGRICPARAHRKISTKQNGTDARLDLTGEYK